MKVLLKFNAFLFVGICIVLGVDGYLNVRGKAKLFDTDIRRDHRLMGIVMGETISNEWRTEGEDEAREMVETATRSQSQIQYRWLVYPGDAATADALGLPERLLNRLGYGEPVSIRARMAGGEEVIHTYVPLAPHGKPLALLELTESLRDELEFIHGAVLRTIGTTLSLAVMAMSLAAALGAWLVGKPMTALVEKARQVGAGDLERPLHLVGHGEFALLADEMNVMCERLSMAREALAVETAEKLATVEQLRHADRLMTVGKLAAGIAHELGTPLNVVAGHAKLIQQRRGAPEEAIEDARVIGHQVMRMTSIIRQLLDFARRRTARKARTDLRELADRVLRLLGPMAEKKRIDLALEAGAEVVTGEIDAGQMEQVLTNVVVNAIQATNGGGGISVRFDHHLGIPPSDVGGPERDWIRIAVRDPGDGISHENLPHVFEPFFTTKDVGEGTGLGLAVSYGIVREHGGWIDIQSQPGHGTVVSIHLPSGEA